MPKLLNGPAAHEAGLAPQRARPAEAQPARAASLRHLAPGAIVQRATAAPQALRPAELMALQRNIGNQAVNALLDRPTPGTGLPDKLKVGIESLSGMSMDGVKVHYNSSRPAQLSALAFAQGTDIHVAPGQEQQLPHEAWHVVQQLQGRVQPTPRFEEGVPVNDDGGLELEADVMGTRAAQIRSLDTTGTGGAAAMGAEQTEMRPEASTPRQLDNATPVAQQMRGAAVLQRKLQFDQSRIKKAKIRNDKEPLYALITKEIKKYNKTITTDESIAIRQSLAKIQDLCEVFLRNYRTTEDSKRKQQIYVIQDLSNAAELEWGQISAQARSLAAVKDPSGSTAARNLYFLAQFLGENPIESAQKQMAERFAQEYGLEPIDLTAIKLFSMDDYKYINPAIANDADWATKQIERIKLRDEASIRLDKYIEDTIKGKSGSLPEPRNLPQERKDERLRIMREEGAHLAALVNRALNKLPALKPTTVYRGARMSPQEFEKVYGRSGEKAGVTKYSHSSTTNLETSQEYAARPAAQGRLNPDQTLSVLCMLNVKSARNIRDISMLPTEDEVVVLTGTKFKVTNFRREKGAAILDG